MEMILNGDQFGYSLPDWFDAIAQARLSHLAFPWDS